MANPQRTDLNNGAVQPVTTATGQQYGEAKAQADAQRAVPLPALGAPTARPDEPIHAGMNSGPGPNAMQAGIPQGPMSAPTNLQQIGDFFRSIYSVYPTDDLADLIATLGEGTS